MVSAQQGRNPSLDFLRCIAIILVIFHHLRISGGGLFNTVARFLNGGGWVGVDLFFVLSGFLISGLIFNEYETRGSFNGWRFLLRRGFKIYPVFYLFMAVTWGMTFYSHVDTPARNGRYLYEALFISNYSLQNPEHDWLWTLCVEEHFYLVLCVLMVILIRSKRITARLFWIIYCFFLVLGVFLRAQGIYRGHDINLYERQSHVRFDALFFGVLLAYLYQYKQKIEWKSTALTLLALLGISLPFFFTKTDDPAFNTVVFLSTNPVCFGYLMIRMLNTRASWMRGFAWIGKYSYPIYLFHGVVNASCYRHFSGWAYYATYFLGSLVIGIVISKLVEYPILALRDKVFPYLYDYAKPQAKQKHVP